MSETKKCLVLLFVILQPFLHTCVAYPWAPFDFFKLVLEWPPTYCLMINCTTPIPQDFVVHGFWPSIYGRPIDPTDCAPLVEYTPITDQNLRDKLNQFWPSLDTDDNEEFWEEQWIRHGTCSLLFYYQMGYFDLAVELREQYDILGRLGDVGIRPSASTTASVLAIRNTIQQYTTKYPQLVCVTNDQGQKLLSEIFLCFEAGGNIIDCPVYGNCNRPYLFLPPPFW